MDTTSWIYTAGIVGIVVGLLIGLRHTFHRFTQWQSRRQRKRRAKEFYEAQKRRATKGR
jgi:uncharacterized membrane-anchored protein YhcB (DUF1043 family)